jgi:hypothetical protein
MNFQEFSFLQRKVLTAKDEQDLPNLGHAFGYVFLQEFYNEIDDISEILTEGKDDLGIDAINIDDESVVDIFQFKYTDKFENKTNKIKDADLDKLSTRIEQILNKQSEILEYANLQVSRKIKQIWNIMEERPVKINVFFVTNYETPMDENRFKSYKNTLRKNSAILEIYGTRKVMSLISKNNVPQYDTVLKFSGKQYFEKSDIKVHSLVGTINAHNLIDALIDPDTNEIAESVFEENVRVYLKRKTKINKQIYTSAINKDNNNFFYFNNGVTITCEKLDYTQNSDSPVIQITNLQIVNGSQTVHALYDVYSDPNLREKLSNVYLLTRIYATEDRDLGQDIAMYTNTQNPVKSRDTRSNDERQKILADELLLHEYKYQRKKNESSSGYTKDRIIDSEKAGQVILSFYLDKPGDAKNKKSKIFDQEYEAIFDREKISAHYVLLPYLIYLDIESETKLLKKEKREILDEGDSQKIEKFELEKEFLLHSQYYRLLACRFIAINRRIEIKFENLEKIASLRHEASDLIYKLINDIKYKNKYPAEIFKQNSFVEDLKDSLDIII